MKKLLVIILIISLFLITGCTHKAVNFDIVATTLPVYEFTVLLCENTDLTIGRLITENVSCLHDYTLQVSQMRMIEESEIIVISGAGLEEFLNDALSSSKNIIDASENTHIHFGDDYDAHDTHDAHGELDHHHENDPHIWLSTENAKHMAQSVCRGLSNAYPQYQETFSKNLFSVLAKLDDLQAYGEHTLADISCRSLITFHDGFAYFAEGFDLNILKSIEEESGSEASAAEIIQLVDLVNFYQLPAVFTEASGSNACARIIAAETDAEICTLDMAMAGDSYFDAMYHNIDTLKEALK